MRTSILVAALVLSIPTFGASPADIRFKAGEMGLVPFLEIVSEKLDLSIDVSGFVVGAQEIVSIPETGALSPERAQALVLTALHLAGYSWVQDTAAGMLRVVRLRDARDQEIPLITDPAKLPDSDQLVTYVMNLDNTPPDFIARSLRSFMPANSRIIADEATRSISITDSAHNIAKLKKLVEQLDTPQAAKEARQVLAKRERDADAECPAPTWGSTGPRPVVLITLFSLIALVIGFLARGYVIRRIEGGL